MILLAGCPVQWESRKQSLMALSTAEAELTAIVEGLHTGRSVRALAELFVEKVDLEIYNDNRAAVVLTAGTGGSWRTRHLRIRASCLTEALRLGELTLAHRVGTSLWADGLTKPLPAQHLSRFCQGVGLGDVEEKSITTEREKVSYQVPSVSGFTMVPLEAAHGGALPPSAGRRYIGCTSVSFAGQHGYGKRHVKAPQEESLDLFNRNGDVDDRLWGRNGPVARGPSPRRREVTHTTWQGQDSPEAKVAKVEHNGISWVVHTLNLEAVSLSKEGSTAKAIAEKLSTMPMTELRHFGLRFMVPEKEVKEAEDVQPFQSQGVPPGRSKASNGNCSLPVVRLDSERSYRAEKPRGKSKALHILWEGDCI
eukprot:g15984.t1